MSGALPAAAADARAEAVAAAALKAAVSDYRMKDYASGLGRLEKALRACGASRCAPATKAAVLRDLGAMEWLTGDKATATKFFSDAIAMQPDLEFNRKYDNPDLRAAWDQARGGGGGGGAGDQPSGDFDYAPPPEHKANTPLPVFVRRDGEPPVRVLLRYRGAAMTEWRRVELKKMSGGWGGLIPCADVTPGEMRFYVMGFDDGGDTAGNAGDQKHPFTVPIREEVTSTPVHLPGQRPPHTCGEGDEDAPVGPEPAGREDPSRLKTADDAGGGYATWWIGITGAVDFVSLPAASDVCSLASDGKPSNSAGYYCSNPNGTDLPARGPGATSTPLVQGQAGQATGGIHPGDVRGMIAVDYALSPGLLVGGRLGVVGNGYPGGAAVVDGKAFSAPVHVEARITYLFGEAPLATHGFSPFSPRSPPRALLRVRRPHDHRLCLPAAEHRGAAAGGGVAVERPAFFIAAGGGVRYQFSRRAAFSAAVRANLAIGGALLATFGPEIAFQYGF